MNKGLELLFVYIHDINRCYKNTSFTFTNDYDISFDIYSKRIIINKKENKHKYFYGNKIESVNLIVGKNGSGKTTVLDLISESITHFGLNYTTKGWFAIYKFKNRMNEFFIEGYNSNIINNSSIQENNNYFNYCICYNFKNNSYSILSKGISTQYSKIIYIKSIKVNKSFNKNYKSHRNIDDEQPIQKLIIEQSKLANIYNLLSKENHFITKELNANNLKCIIETEYGDGQRDDDIEPFIIPTFNSYHFRKNKKELFIYRLLIKCIYEYKHSLSSNRLLSIPDSIRTINENVTLQSYLDLFFELINQEFEYLGVADKYILFRHTFNKFLDSIEKLDEKYFEYSIEISCKSFDENVYEFIKIYDELKDCLPDNENSILSKTISLKFKNISEGEATFLETFANIYRTVELNEISNGNVILLLDEPDQSFHPEWSAKFISMLTALIKRITQGKDLTFQIIITTHSPFMISDVPKEFITCIDIDENGNRLVKNSKYGFASNFYDIIQDSFFLKSSIGEFAENKINKWINEINSLSCNSNRLYEIENEINVIDDSIIKNALKNMISEKITNRDLLARLKSLEDEIAEIKEKIGDSYD